MCWRKTSNIQSWFFSKLVNVNTCSDLIAPNWSRGGDSKCQVMILISGLFILLLKFKVSRNIFV